MTTIAITGINSYFAKTVLPHLIADPEIEKIIGIDITPCPKYAPKIQFHQKDVRDSGIASFFQGVDTVLHLAFIVAEIHDKRKTREINIDGSRNVFEACARYGVKKMVYTSSIAAYGSHPDNPIGLREDYPLVPNPDSYYSSNKVAVEKILMEFSRSNLDMVVTVFRPPIIMGPNLSPFAQEPFKRQKTLFIRGRDPEIQYLHEDDLGEALYLAVKKDLPGTYNIAADDYSKMRHIFQLAGVKVNEVSLGTMRMLANLTFALRLGKMSQHWVSLMEFPIIVNNDKFKKVSGWQPKYTTEGAFRDFLHSMK